MPRTVIPVLISGGAGTRLWPLSTETEPKQFHALGADRSLIQQTALRLAHFHHLTTAAPMVICNLRHRRIVEEQMAEIGVLPSEIVLEPFGRNTAAVAMVASLLAQKQDPEALVLLMPSDHLIPDPDGFARTIAEAMPAAHDRIVLLGVVPTSPETGFGYIEAGPVLDGPVCAVARFVEKPDLASAEAYLASGTYLWNAGIFLFSPEVMLAEMRAWAPQVAAAAEAALSKGRREGVALALDADAFTACPSISLDYAVMEKTAKAAVVPLKAEWSDIGSWSSVWNQGPHDASGNMVHGSALLVDTEGCLIWSEDRTVGTIGLKDLIVVQTKEAVIVLPRSRAQDVKRLVDQARAQGRKTRA